MKSVTASTGISLNFEWSPERGSEQVYPCRCGQTHRGDYAGYDWGHHNCFHETPLHRIDSDYFMCPDCGMTFTVGE